MTDEPLHELPRLAHDIPTATAVLAAAQHAPHTLPDHADETPEARMRDALRRHAAGVALVTTETVDGPVGLTITSLSSVAIAPRVLMFSFTHHSGAAGAILEAETFIVHLLNDTDADIARAFGTTGGARFTDDQHWSRLPSGEPYLPSASAAIRCRRRDELSVGESRIIVADVLEVVPCAQGAPLVYCDHVFHALADLGSRSAE